MTLKEKLQSQVEIPLNLKEVQKLEKIANEFAIEFAEWITRAELPLKELLGIYKKEKGL